MSLFGAMSSGVSGLSAQSSAMGSIADNITNVSTTGYKGTRVDFQTLVTKQSSGTFYSAGGVQSKPRTGVDVQGLLQSNSSQTALAISGDGFFVVNESSEPGPSDQFMYTRAGNFYTDEQGYLKNTGGYYLQGWPVDAEGNVILPVDSNSGLTNQNIISTDFLETINLNRVGGTAASTTEISIGANLPANDEIDGSHNIDVQFYDSLGNSNAVAFDFTKVGANQWDLSVLPPKGAAGVTLTDANGNVFRSAGQLEFTDQPAEGATITINGITYEFDSDSSVTGTNVAVTLGATLPESVTNLRDAIKTDPAFDGSANDHTVSLKSGDTTTLVFEAGSGPATFSIDASALNTASGGKATLQGTLENPVFNIRQRDLGATPAITFNAQGLPESVNVTTMSVVGFSSGAADMDGTDADPINLDFGSIGEADGLTQFGAEFTPSYIEQNGARFGVFNGITISSDGIVSALFDNGERRPIYKLPLVTFVNPDGLQAQSGNAWIATEASGNPTLRVADSGPSGQIVQSSLEASTVDIGEEFTNMIVVQRAYSAATRIISTCDDMLEELVRIKR